MTRLQGRIRTLLVVLAGGTTAAACTRSDAQEAEPAAAVPVRTAEVVEEAVSRPIVATGTLGARDEVALSFKAGGVIAGIRVDAGDVVSAGQVLAALDLRDIDAAVARAHAAVAQAKRDLGRARRLYADSVIPLAQLQDAETAAELARADVESAEFNRRYAVIVAPVAGVVLARHAEAGETVAAGSPVLRVASHARGWVVRVGLADRDRVRVRSGDPARVRFDALPGRVFDGRVSEIGAAALPGTGTYEVEVAVPQAAGLATGLIASVEIEPAAAGATALVPVEAVLEADGDRGVVFALSVDGAHAERREVTIAFLHDDRIAVSAGLEGVSTIVTDGAAFLNDGAAVKVVR